ncbi:hypothetical protein ACSSS7_007952 [Eimeria intestinalis]
MQTFRVVSRDLIYDSTLELRRWLCGEAYILEVPTIAQSCLSTAEVNCAPSSEPAVEDGLGGDSGRGVVEGAQLDPARVVIDDDQNVIRLLLGQEERAKEVDSDKFKPRSEASADVVPPPIAARQASRSLRDSEMAAVVTEVVVCVNSATAGDSRKDDAGRGVGYVEQVVHLLNAQRGCLQVRRPFRAGAGMEDRAAGEFVDSEREFGQIEREGRAREAVDVFLLAGAMQHLQPEFLEAQRPAFKATTLRAVIADVLKGRTARANADLDRVDVVSESLLRGAGGLGDDAVALLVRLQEDRAEAFVRAAAIEVERPFVV